MTIVGEKPPSLVTQSSTIGNDSPVLHFSDTEEIVGNEKSKHDPEAALTSSSLSTVEESEEPYTAYTAYTAYTSSRQLFIVLIATAAGVFAPIAGGAYLPNLILFESVFHASGAVINATVSVYSAIYAVTPLFAAPVSDYFGRKGVYIITLGIFLVTNTLLATLPATIGGLFTLRVFGALGASVVTSVGAGTVADVTESAKRASRMGIFLLGPSLGPVLGPLIGGQFSTLALWRWVFGFLSIACFPVYLLILFFLPETLRSLVGNGSFYANSSTWLVRPRLRQKQVVPEDLLNAKLPRLTFKKLFSLLLFVPNLIITVASGLQFSGLYCIYLAFPRVWQGDKYNWSGTQTGYAYIVPAVCLLLSTLLIGRLSDFLYRRYKSQHEDRAPPPERRIDIQLWGYLLGAAGKALFGWLAYKGFHPAGPLAASGLAAVGTGLVMVTSTAYQSEFQPSAAATASIVALGGLLRNLGCSVSAAIIDPLLTKINLGWFFTGLAILDAICTFGIVYIRVRGHTYRET
ncbi:major facilitator superfamily domain-containing protein [Xylariaceae sp. FL0255]|nr:major facilitator superfamily domain-containing protein [Xylariaceae sp. FL0255]